MTTSDRVVIVTGGKGEKGDRGDPGPSGADLTLHADLLDLDASGHPAGVVTTAGPAGWTTAQEALDGLHALAVALQDADDVEATTRATADTAEVSARNTAIATAIDALVDGAPGLLDTLAEIADALSDDDDAIAALVTAVSARATQVALAAEENRALTAEGALYEGEINRAADALAARVAAEADLAADIETEAAARAAADTAEISARDTAISIAIAASRGPNLITNGNGILRNNYNFSPFTFDPVETFSGAGSFLLNEANAKTELDEFIPVDVSRIYRLSGWAKSGEAGGTNFNPANRQYFGVFCYDADKLLIDNMNFRQHTGSVDTTVAVAVDPGALTVTLTDATGWSVSGAAATRQFGWWPYSNSFGYPYPSYSYTRNHTNDGDDKTSGLWSAGGITGNVITLRAPWSRAALPAGTPVRNLNAAPSYSSVAASVIVPNDWTNYSGPIGAIDMRPGTVFMKPRLLVNTHQAADNNVRWSNLWFGEADAEYLAADNETLSWIGV